MIAATRARPRPGQVDHELLWGATGAAFLAAVAFLPRPSLLGIPCLFKLLTGFACPSCGMTRAWEALAEGEWLLALRLHPALAAVYLAMGLYVPYALGAAAGAWPRVRISVSPGAAALLRASVLLSLACLWIFLIVDGR